MARNLKNVLKYNTFCLIGGGLFRFWTKPDFFSLIIKYARPSGTCFDIVNLHASEKHTEQWIGTA